MRPNFGGLWRMLFRNCGNLLTAKLHLDRLADICCTFVIFITSINHGIGFYNIRSCSAICPNYATSANMYYAQSFGQKLGCLLLPLSMLLARTVYIVTSTLVFSIASMFPFRNTCSSQHESVMRGSLSIRFIAMFIWCKRKHPFFY